MVTALCMLSGGCVCRVACSYQKSNTHRFEVPRMLFEDPEQLGRYILDSNDE